MNNGLNAGIVSSTQWDIGLDHTSCQWKALIDMYFLCQPLHILLTNKKLNNRTCMYKKLNERCNEKGKGIAPASSFISRAPLETGSLAPSSCSSLQFGPLSRGQDAWGRREYGENPYSFQTWSFYQTNIIQNQYAKVKWYFCFLHY